MQILDHQPGFWFLLSDGDALFLDVSCEHSAVSYSVLIQLNNEELSRYGKEGIEYLNVLADAINYSAPGVVGSASIYKVRNISLKFNEEVMAAVATWRAEYGN